MRLYLVQHGEAKDKSEDPDRHLTENGRGEVGKIAAFLRPLGLEVKAVRHSGKARAAETAAILAEAFGCGGGAEQQDGLAPKDPVAPVAAEIESAGEDACLVGHLPFMSNMASLLVAGDQEEAAVAFRYGAVLCLEKDPEQGWRVAWYVRPDLLA
jgi:phosphohistidine phosphatase